MRLRLFGNPILNAMVIGRDINVVAGFATLVGHITYAGNLWSCNYFISGSIALVMGGVLTMVGGNTINSNLMQVQIGWVCQLGTCEWRSRLGMDEGLCHRCVGAFMNGCIDSSNSRRSFLLRTHPYVRRRWRLGHHRLGLHIDQRPPLPPERRAVWRQ